ncbi:MAG: hypothetical protein FWB72_04000 [Firmicutes bacterium]|nr:hypothetical protein [Bacillota bacterium]
MEFTFDLEAVEKHGYCIDVARKMIKEQAEEFKLKCVSDNELLAFEGSGLKSDFSGMLGMMRVFAIQSNWVAEIANSWILITSDGWEDVLRQVKEKYARGELYDKSYG